MNETNSTAANGDVVGSSAPNYFDVPIMALSLTVTQIVFRLCVVGVGMVLNCVVFLVVSCSRQLRYPRHIFWAAVLLVDYLFLSHRSWNWASLSITIDWLADSTFSWLSPTTRSCCSSFHWTLSIVTWPSLFTKGINGVSPTEPSSCYS